MLPRLLFLVGSGKEGHLSSLVFDPFTEGQVPHRAFLKGHHLSLSCLFKMRGGVKLSWTEKEFLSLRGYL